MPFSWIKNYPEGVPAEIFPDKYHSLVDLLDQACEKHADRVAVVSMGARLTYRQIDRAAQGVAQWLQSLGLPKGTRVAVMLPNVPAYLVSLLAILRAGYVLVNVNPLYTSRELSEQLRDSEAKVIVVLETFANTLEQAGDCGVLQHSVVVQLGDLHGAFRGRLINFVARNIKRLVSGWSLPNALMFDDVIAQGSRAPWVAPDVHLDDLAALQYTGGTTGKPRGAMLSHRNLVANVLQIEQIAKPALFDVTERQLSIMTALPLYHVLAMTICGIYAMYAGMLNVLVINPRDRPKLVDIWRKHPVHIFPGVNTLFNALLNDVNFRKLNFGRLRLAFGGGMAIQSNVAQEWFELTGRPLIEGYGLSETSPVVCANPTNAANFSGSIGLPVPSTEVVIVDEYGRCLESGEVGEIAVRGPQVMQGYWRAPRVTQEAFTSDGFLLTGDIGVMDEAGYTRLVDRKKDMITVSGFKVFPSEIEAVVAEHPGVSECAAIAVPDTQSSEAVKLFVVCKDGSLTVADLQAWCSERLTRYKCPRQIQFMQELPKTNVGKILRRALRDV